MVGIVTGDTYISRRVFPQHYLRIVKGYAVSVEILEQLKYNQVTKIQIVEHKGDVITTYEGTTKQFLSGREVKFYDAQRGVPVSEMKMLKKEDPKQKTLG